jgi:hypothetical protein
MREILERFLKASALLEQRTDGFVLKTSDSYAGYLVGDVNGAKVFVPWHLVEIFPPHSVLSEMHTLSQRVKLGSEGAICLSGSSVFRGALQAVGDIDFCEYIFNQPSQVPSLIDSLIMRLDDVWLARIYVPTNRQENYRAPWKGGCPTNLAAAFRRARSSARAPVLMFEYVSVDSLLGVLPVTNRVLPVNRTDPAADHGQTTFVFQEAVFCEGDPPPRLLVSPIELADYIVWLRRELRKRASNDLLNSVKRLKRALSLARIICLDELSTRALSALSDGRIERYVRQTAATKARKLLRYLELDPSDVLSRKIDAFSDLEPRLSRLELNKLENHIQKVVDDIADAYDAIGDRIVRVVQ